MNSISYCSVRILSAQLMSLSDAQMPQVQKRVNQTVVQERIEHSNKPSTIKIIEFLKPVAVLQYIITSCFLKEFDYDYYCLSRVVLS